MSAAASPTQRIRVVIADDQPLVRAGVRTLLELDPDIEVVAEAEHGRQAVSLVRELAPDVVLMDIRMPQLDGLEATRRIVADPALRSTKVLVLTTFDGDHEVIEAIRSGASGYLLKDFEPAQLRAAIHTVAAGGHLLAPAVTRRVMERIAQQPDPPSADPVLGTLAERERQVLRRVALGDTNDEIAAALHLSPATARTYVSRLLAKLGARDRARLVILAYENGIVTIGDDGAPT